MHNHINQVTHLNCPTCKDAMLTLRQNKRANTLFLGCQTYQTTQCPGSLPLTDELVIELRNHWDSRSDVRQLSLLEKGHRKAYLSLRYEVFDGADTNFDDILEVGNAELSFDNLVLAPSDVKGLEIFTKLLEVALQNILLD